MSNVSANSKTIRAIKLGVLPRCGVGAVGAVGLGAGGVAVFTRNVEAGPVALILLGYAFLLIGTAGYLPTRLRIGENEAEWVEAVSDALDNVIGEVPFDRLPRVEEAIEKLSEKAPTIAKRARDAIDLEQVFLRLLRSAASQVGATVELEPRMSVNSARPDAIVEGPNGRKIWVITVGRHLRTWELGASAELLEKVKARDDAFVGILVVAAAIIETDRLNTIVVDAGKIWLAPVRADTDGTNIDPILREVYGQAS